MDYDICGRVLRCIYDIFRDNGLSEYTIKRTYLQIPNADRKVETYILNFGDFLVKDKDSILYHNNGIEASQYLFIPSAEYSFCNILAAAINKSNFDEVKKLWEQK